MPDEIKVLDHGWVRLVDHMGDDAATGLAEYGSKCPANIRRWLWFKWRGPHNYELTRAEQEWIDVHCVYLRCRCCGANTAHHARRAGTQPPAPRPATRTRTGCAPYHTAYHQGCFDVR